METRATSGVSSTAATETKPKNQLGQNEFVRLLVAQLGNQDPTAPMESADFVAQLAQFANVQLLQGVETRLDALVVAQASANQTAAVGLVGREVVFRTDRVQLEKAGAKILADLGGAAETVTVTITDDSGRTVRTLRLGAAAKGQTTIPWDGRDDAGRLLPEGSYGVRVAAADATGASVPVEQLGRGMATGVSYENGYPELLVGSLRIQLSDVAEFHAV